MTNEDKLREVFPKTIFVQHKEGDKLTALVCSDEWLSAEYQEPIPKNDLGVDCISRTSALDCINWAYNLSDAYKKINELSSVTPIRPKGHWICDGKGRSFADYHCSECGLKLALCGQDIKQRQDSGYSLFCGGCGADMREVEE